MRSTLILPFLFYTFSIIGQTDNCYQFMVEMEAQKTVLNPPKKEKVFDGFSDLKDCIKRSNILRRNIEDFYNKKKQNTEWQITSVSDCKLCKTKEVDKVTYNPIQSKAIAKSNETFIAKEAIRNSYFRKTINTKVYHNKKKDRPISWVGYLRRAEYFENEKNVASTNWEKEALLNYLQVLQMNEHNEAAHWKVANYLEYFGFYKEALLHLDWLIEFSLESKDLAEVHKIACAYVVDIGVEKNEFEKFESNEPIIEKQFEYEHLEKLSLSIIMNNNLIEPNRGLNKAGKEIEQILNKLSQWKIAPRVDNIENKNKIWLGMLTTIGTQLKDQAIKSGNDAKLLNQAKESLQLLLSLEPAHKMREYFLLSDALY